MLCRLSDDLRQVLLADFMADIQHDGALSGYLIEIVTVQEVISQQP
jgi:hypothetical protein